MAILQRDVRASDHDREAAVALLKAHYADGRLSATELAWRSESAYRAVGMSELGRLTSDLPRPLPERRSHHAAIGVLVLAITAWVVIVPPEVMLGLVALVAALAVVAGVLLAPLWIPALLAFLAYRLIRAAR